MNLRCIFGFHDSEPNGKTDVGSPCERCRRCDDRRHFLITFGNWTRWHPQRWFDRRRDEADRDRQLVQGWPE